jgi:hypothetical protein
VNVLRDTHTALVPGGLLLDFHPIAPPWPRVLARGEELGELRHEPFLDDLRATEGGAQESVRLGLFEPVASLTRDIAGYFDDLDELLEGWSNDEEQWVSAELEGRLRSATWPVEVVDRVVFNLYRKLEIAKVSRGRPLSRSRGRL